MIELRGSFSLRRHRKLCASLLCASLVALVVPLSASLAGATVSSTAIVDTGLQHPYQVAFNDGNMYIAGGDSGSVQEVTAAQLTGPAPYTPLTLTTGTGGQRITTIMFDTAGNLWYGDQNGGGVYEITAGQLAGPTPVTSTEIFSVPGAANGIAFDASGDLYVADSFSTIYEVTVGQLHTVTPVVTAAVAVAGLQPLSLTFESGNLWFSNQSGGVYEIPAGQLGGATITSATEMISTANAPEPWGVLFDPSGNLLVADQTGIAYEVTATQIQSGPPPYVPTLLANSFSNPIDLTFDPSGNLLLVAFASSTIWELGYVAPPAPTNVAPITGLSVSETSGSVGATWAPDPNATSFTCTLLYGFNDPSTFTKTTTAPTCSYAVNTATSWGISVTANNSSGSSGAVSAFGSAVAPPIVKKVKSIACTNGKHSRRFYGLAPKCPRGWWLR